MQLVVVKKEKQRDYTRQYRERIGKEENNRRARASRAKIKVENPLKYKATFMAGRLCWGVGAGQKMEALLELAIDRPCPYCLNLITLDSASVDHKIPILINRKLVTAEYRKKMGNIKNIHIVCKTCNQTKGSMTHNQFVGLLKFLNRDPDLKEKVLFRLRTSNMVFRKK